MYHYPQHYTMPYRRRRRMSRPRSVVQTFKKVLNVAPASHAAAGTFSQALSVGQDSVAAGQTTAQDANVPTGSIITEFVIQYSFVNLVAIASFMHWSIQRIESGQGTIAPNAVGGDPQRNQVHLQGQVCLGQNQNGNREIRFKVPKKYQRVKEGSQWVFRSTCDTIWTDALQVIYKFSR